MGNGNIGAKFHGEIGQYLSKNALQLWQDKKTERQTRIKNHANRYMLEPNIKEGKGALRDCHFRALGGKKSCHLLMRNRWEKSLWQEYYPPSEWQKLRKIEDFMLKIRIQAHLLRKNGGDILAFDLQHEISGALKYKARQLRAVEVFMRQYFLYLQKNGALIRKIFAMDEILYENSSEIFAVSQSNYP